MPSVSALAQLHHLLGFSVFNRLWCFCVDWLTRFLLSGTGSICFTQIGSSFWSSFKDHNNLINWTSVFVEILLRSSFVPQHNWHSASSHQYLVPKLSIVVCYYHPEAPASTHTLPRVNATFSHYYTSGKLKASALLTLTFPSGWPSSRAVWSLFLAPAAFITPRSNRRSCVLFAFHLALLKSNVTRLL